MANMTPGSRWGGRRKGCDGRGAATPGLEQVTSSLASSSLIELSLPGCKTGLRIDLKTRLGLMACDREGLTRTS